MSASHTGAFLREILTPRPARAAKTVARKKAVPRKTAARKRA
jgi:hypothetical protein